MSHIIHPVEYYEIQPEEKVIFLAGPGSGTHDWRAQAIDILSSGDFKKDIVIATPTLVNEEKSYTPGQERYFKRARQWEMYYLRKAVETGVVLFWLEKQMFPIGEDDTWMQKKPYASMTRIELGQLMSMHLSKLAVGIHPEFHEKSVLLNDLQQSNYLDLSVPYNPHYLSDVVVSDTLEDVCTRTKILLGL